MPLSPILSQLQVLASSCSEIEVLWLYGSQAKGTATQESDFDLAVALTNAGNHELSSNLLEDLKERWSQLTRQTVSIIDINRAPIPLAVNVIQEGLVLTCRSSLRLHSEQARIWSLWESYRYEFFNSRSGV